MSARVSFNISQREAFSLTRCMIESPCHTGKDQLAMLDAIKQLGLDHWVKLSMSSKALAKFDYDTLSDVPEEAVTCDEDVADYVINVCTPDPDTKKDLVGFAALVLGNLRVRVSAAKKGQ